MRDPSAFSNVSTPEASVPSTPRGNISPVLTEAPTSRPSTPLANTVSEIPNEVTPRAPHRTTNDFVRSEDYEEFARRRHAMHEANMSVKTEHRHSYSGPNKEENYNPPSPAPSAPGKL